MTTDEQLTVTWAGATHVGRARSNNEDAVFPDGSGKGTPPLTFAVADGLGGEPAGDVASRIAIDAVAEVAGEPMMAVAVVAAAESRLHDYIEANSEADPELARMSTTLTVAVLGANGGIEFGHAGDSRAYLFNDGELVQVTGDHSVAMDMVRAGTISETEAAQHRGWDTISNCLGSAPARVETVSLRIRPGDRILLCTDGLTNMVPDALIARLLRTHPDDAECVDALIDTANEAGGRDNITVVVATIAQ